MLLRLVFNGNYYKVTDSIGRVVMVAFNEETGELFNLSTQMNDVIPSFNMVGGVG